LIVIDGSYGEGGGQIVRSSLALSAVTGQELRIEKVRAGRTKPGLAAQHLTSVRAVAALCDAEVEGAELGSLQLDFAPGRPVQAGAYDFDVAAARLGGSAGSAPLVIQTVLLPLALAEGTSQVTVRGGTHVAWSPPFDDLRDAWLPVLRRLGLRANLSLVAWGWFPVGRGEIRAEIEGLGGPDPHPLRPADWREPGNLLAVTGRAVVANLPAHIAQRMAGRAREALAETGAELDIGVEQVRAACPGAGIFLAARYEHIVCGFSALGERGKPAERVAEEAAETLLAHRRSGAAIDRHLADQILLPLTFAGGASGYTAEAVTPHLRTNAYVIERFGLAEIRIEEQEDGTGLVTVVPGAAERGQSSPRKG
jgi:RNA 3'-terminal phosphate cyclase (ATP)